MSKLRNGKCEGKANFYRGENEMKMERKKPFYSVNFIWKILHDKWSNQNLLYLMSLDIVRAASCESIVNVKESETINDDDLSVSKVIERIKLSMFEVSRVSCSSHPYMEFNDITSSSLKCEEMIVKLLLWIKRFMKSQR